MAFRLQFEDLSGNLVHERILDDGEITIGRSPDCAVTLASSSVSREHARFFGHLGRAYVEDLGSANGVVVDGIRIRGVHPLTGPSVVVVGDHIVRFTPVTTSGSGLLIQPAAGQRPALVRLDAAPTGSRILDLPRGISRVGRGSTAEVQVADPSVSRLHAEMRVDGPRVSVADLRSANGTFVNGARVSRPTAIADGDIIQFGDIPTAFTTAPVTFDWRSATAPPPGARAGGPSKLVWVAATLAAIVIVGAVLVLLFTLYAEPEGPGALDVAAAATDSGDWTAAITAYEQALTEQPESQGIVDALARARAELGAEEALARCDQKIEAAGRLVTSAETSTALAAYAEARTCLQSVDPSSTAGTQAAETLSASVVPALVELHRDAGAQALAAADFDNAIQHLRTARRLHEERAAAGDAAAMDTEIRAAYIAAGRAAFTAEDWARAESMLNQAHAIQALDGADATRLTQARTNAARSR